MPFIHDCEELVALEAFLRHKAGVENVNGDIHGPLKPYYEAGKERYNNRTGQLDMACNIVMIILLARNCAARSCHKDTVMVFLNIVLERVALPACSDD